MTSLTASYGITPPALTAFGIIEQDDWSAYAGRMTKYNLALAVANMLFGDRYVPSFNCGFDAGGNVYTTIRVYPYQPHKSYVPKLTAGVLGECEVVDEVIEEKVRFSLETTASLKYPSQGIESVEWLYDCYDANLNKIVAPALSTDGDEVVAGAAVYGTALVKYRVICHVYQVSISLRGEAEENKYSSVFYCLWGGPVAHHVLSAPPGADELEGECGVGGATSVSSPDPDDPTSMDPSANRHTKRDWCSRTLISDTIS